MQKSTSGYDPIRNYTRYRRRLIGFVALGVAIAILVLVLYGTWWFRLGRLDMTATYREQVLAQQSASTAIPPENPLYQVYTPENRLAKLEEQSTFLLTQSWEMPILDGDAEAFPLYAAFAQHCYKDIAGIDAYGGSVDPLRCTGSAAFEKLVNGTTDIYFGEELTSEQSAQLATAEIPVRSVPLATHVLVFYVHEDNPVDSLTADQLRGVLAGEYTNWSQLGGLNLPLLAFQQPTTASAHTWLMDAFMGDVKPAAPLMAQWWDDAGKSQTAPAVYQNKLSSIGYAFLDELTAEASLKEQHIKVLAIDEVPPTERNIATCRYPLLYTLYAHGNANSEKSQTAAFLAWMQTEQAKELIRLSGWRLYTPRPAGLQ